MKISEPFSWKVLNGTKVILHLMAVLQQNLNVRNDILPVITGAIIIITLVWILRYVPAHNCNNL
jgi:hypothetical protein